MKILNDALLIISGYKINYHMVYKEIVINLNLYVVFYKDIKVENNVVKIANIIGKNIVTVNLINVVK